VGAAKIPLIYLARNERDNPDGQLILANFGTPTEYLIEATIFRGRHYDIDNPRFYRELKSFTERVGRTSRSMRGLRMGGVRIWH
jgi:hypothetical protein